MKLLSCVRLLVTPWTAAHPAPLSMGFSRQEHWSGCHYRNTTVAAATTRASTTTTIITASLVITTMCVELGRLESALRVTYFLSCTHAQLCPTWGGAL